MDVVEGEKTGVEVPVDLWGKWLVADGVPYPLLGHLLDTAAIASRVWGLWVSDPLKRRLARALPDCDVESSYVWLAGSHDLGKADPVFQGQLLAHRRPDARFGDHLELSGLPQPDEAWLRNVNAYMDVLRPFLRHEAVTADLLQRMGASNAMCAVVSGHHGRYPCSPPSGAPVRVLEHRDFLSSGPWRVQHMELMAAVATAIGVHETPRLEGLTGELVPLLTGLVVLADWLASDESFVASSPQHLLGEPRTYYETRRRQADEHLQTRLGCPVSRSGPFEGLFGFPPDRPVQEWAVNNSEPSGLTIIAVPMGEGKTETALWLHSVAEKSREGLIFALPTTATADAMFDRVRDFYGNATGLAHLAHGHAILNSFHSESSNRPVSVCDDEAGLSASPWFSGPHRALLAPVTVSTCDQVLAVGISHRYIAVRLVGLASKHVILDEVHTYDPYQDRLLERALGWLGAYGARVTLLSATLPARRLVSYLRAYAAGAGSPVGDTQQRSSVYPAVTTLTESGVQQFPVDSIRQYGHRIRIHRLLSQHPDSATADLFRELAVPETRSGLIVNTVDRAIAIAKALRPSFPDLVVLHSRMTARQRALATDRLLLGCGKNTPAGPLAVVATQIAEASLDIDLDLLLSDLAPMTSLLQRMGRQWRHSTPGPNGSWTHRDGFGHRAGLHPTAHIVCQLDEDGNPQPSSRFPYTRAELLKTWSRPEALACGNRSVLQIPGDVQTAVDGADVSFSDLDHEDFAELSENVLLDHLSAELYASNAAEAIGVGAPQVRQGWDRDPLWEGCEMLARLTLGELWRADGVTRLRDSYSITVVPCDPERLNPHAWPGSAESLLPVRSRADQLEILRHVIPVTGRLAHILRDRCPVADSDGWRRHPVALLRSVVPLDLGDVAELCELTEFGLERRGR